MNIKKWDWSIWLIPDKAPFAFLELLKWSIYISLIRCVQNSLIPRENHVISIYIISFLISLQTFNNGLLFTRLKKKVQGHLRLRSPGTAVSWKFLSPRSLKAEDDLEKVLYYNADDLLNAEKGNGIVYHKQQAHTDIMTNVICQVRPLFNYFGDAW